MNKIKYPINNTKKKFGMAIFFSRPSRIQGKNAANQNKSKNKNQRNHLTKIYYSRTYANKEHNCESYVVQTKGISKEKNQTNNPH